MLVQTESIPHLAFASPVVKQHVNAIHLAARALLARLLMRILVEMGANRLHPALNVTPVWKSVFRIVSIAWHINALVTINARFSLQKQPVSEIVITSLGESLREGIQPVHHNQLQLQLQPLQHDQLQLQLQPLQHYQLFCAKESYRNSRL